MVLLLVLVQPKVGIVRPTMKHLSIAVLLVNTLLQPKDIVLLVLEERIPLPMVNPPVPPVVQDPIRKVAQQDVHCANLVPIPLPLEFLLAPTVLLDIIPLRLVLPPVRYVHPALQDRIVLLVLLPVLCAVLDIILPPMGHLLVFIVLLVPTILLLVQPPLQVVFPVLLGSTVQ